MGLFLMPFGALSNLSVMGLIGEAKAMDRRNSIAGGVYGLISGLMDEPIMKAVYRAGGTLFDENSENLGEKIGETSKQMYSEFKNTKKEEARSSKSSKSTSRSTEIIEADFVEVT